MLSVSKIYYFRISLIFIISLAFNSCFDNVNKNTKTDNSFIIFSVQDSLKKIIKITEQRIAEDKENYKYIKLKYKYSTGLLKILSIDNSEIIKINIDTNRFGKYMRISEKQDSLFYFITVSPSCHTSFMGLLIKNNLKWIIYEFNPCSTTAGFKILPNARYGGHSSDNKYFLIEGGTSGGVRAFNIYNIAGEKVKQGTYVSMPYEIFGWNKKDEIVYYNKPINLKGNLKKLKNENEEYVQKRIWSNGKDSLTNIYIPIEIGL